MPKNTPNVPCIFDPLGRAGICGDWLLGSSVESAALSGMALANHVNAFIFVTSFHFTYLDPQYCDTEIVSVQAIFLFICLVFCLEFPLELLPQPRLKLCTGLILDGAQWYQNYTCFVSNVIDLL